MSEHRKLWSDLGMDVDLHEKLLHALGVKYRDVILSQPNRPEHMAYFDHAVHESHGGRVQEIVDAKRQGAKMIGTFCIYVPDEIILAAGAIPVALCGGTAFSIPYAEKMFPRDICPLVKSTLGLAFSKTCPYAPIKDLAVGETTCDAKKKTWDILAQKVNFHVLEVPQKKTDQARDLWLKEVRQFKDRVEELTGTTVEPKILREKIKLVNRKRRLLLDLNDLRKSPLPPISGKDALTVAQVALIDEPERFCRELAALIAELRDRAESGISPFAEGAPRVMVAGSPSVMGNWKVHDIIETSGASVVCDESCTGTRYFEHLVDESGTSLEGQLAALADRYFRIDCSCFSPNNERIDRALQLVEEYRADAVVQYILQYCHGYNIEAIRIRGALKKAGVPSLEIETDYSEEDTGQLRTRIEALLEGIEK